MLAVDGAVDDVELSRLHAAAFGHDPVVVGWAERLSTRSLFWVTARRASLLIGFVNVIGDGGAHAVLLDTCVHPDSQRSGVGAALVRGAADEARRRGCRWVHADYLSEHARFYEGVCGLRPTRAGLLDLRP